MGIQTAHGRRLHDLFKEIFHLQSLLASLMDQVHEQAGLKTAEIKILRCLKENGPCTVPDIASILAISRQAVQTTANGLAGRNLVVLTANPRHKRSKLMGLTDLGESALLQTREKESQIIAKALPDMDPDHVLQAADLIRAIRKRLE